MSNPAMKLAALFPFVLAASATAAIPPSAGNVAQQPCEASRVSSLREMGQVSTGRNLVTKDRKTNVGNVLKPGDLVYYVALVDGVKYYTTPKQIEIIIESHRYDIGKIGDSSKIRNAAFLKLVEVISPCVWIQACNSRMYAHILRKHLDPFSS